jgi:glycosyltransferase involved in cell wall biosynthesis
MTRALLLSPSSVPGGAERVFTTLAEVLPKHGVDVEAVLLQSGPLEDWLTEIGCAYEVVEAGRTRQLARTRRSIRRIAELAARNDVVVSVQTKGHVYGGLAGRRARRPSIRWQQGHPQRWGRIEMVATAIGSSAIVCTTAADAAQQRVVAPRQKVVQIPNGVAVRAVAARRGDGRAVRSAAGLGDEPVVGIVGRLEPWKGQETFLRAAALVARVRPDVRFAVVGGAVLGWEGDYAAALERLAADLGIADRTTFTGHHPDVFGWFDALDIVVHASEGEPFGLVIVEAMALGKPLVAAASGGPIELVEEGISGLLVPPRDDSAYADAILRYLDDPTWAASVSTAARARAEAFSDDVMGAGFASLIDQLT